MLGKGKDEAGFPLNKKSGVRFRFSARKLRAILLFERLKSSPNATTLIFIPLVIRNVSKRHVGRR